MTQFKAEVFQNAFVPQGAGEVNAIMTVTAEGTEGLGSPGIRIIGIICDNSGSMDGGKIHAAHTGLGGKGHELRLRRGQVAAAQAELFLGQDRNAAAFRRFVGERGQLRGIRQTFRGENPDSPGNSFWRSAARRSTIDLPQPSASRHSTIDRPIPQ